LKGHKIKDEIRHFFVKGNFALKLFVFTIVFTIFSFKKESWFMFSTCYLLLIEKKDVE